jgi:8-oxo-dGTP diphosphatase
MNKKDIHVVAAVIKKNDLYFVAQRKNKGELALKWEFPGGKIEKNESHEEALCRELLEELNILVSVNGYITTINHEYQTFRLTMYVYQVEIIKGSIVLNEHINHMWVKKDQLIEVDLADADKPIIPLLK